MKTGEEKFDDEIRQKLRHSEVTPPAGLFDQIVPHKDRKRGFFWFWIAGVISLGLTVSLVKFEQASYNKDNYKANTRNSNTTVNENSRKSANTPSSINSEKLNNKTGEINKTNTDNTTLNYVNSERGKNSSNQHENNSKNFKSSLQKKNQPENFSDYVNNKKNTAYNSGNYQSNLKNNEAFASYNYTMLYIPGNALPYHQSDIIHQNIRVMSPDKTQFNPHTPTPFAIELIISKLTGYNKTTAETSDTMAVRLLNSRDDSDANSSGFDIGALFSYDLNNKFKLSAGIHYSERKQDFNFNFEEYYNELNIDTIQYYILFPFSPPQLVTEYDSTILHLSHTQKIEHQLIFKSVSVSADLRYQLPAGRFMIEPQVGVIADIYSTISGNTTFNPQFEERKGEDQFDNKIQTRLKGGIQVGYALNEKYNVFIQSEYQYALTSMHTANSFYSEKTNILSLGGGLKYTIFKRQAAKP